MKIGLLKKGLVLGIIILFVGACIIPSLGGTVVEKTSNGPISNGNTLYVGGSGLNNYTKIQDAIDDASGGYTVFVYDDSSPYYENVRVYKSITLIGEDRSTTVIDGSCVGDVVYVSANWVTVKGFTIQNSDIWGAPEKGACIKIESNANTIENNIIFNPLTSGDGVYIERLCNNNSIANNLISNNTNGIYLDVGCNYNTITGNTITYNERGILFGYKFNTIIGNNISKNGVGIHLGGGNNNTIERNTISENGGGLSIRAANNNKIQKNNFHRNPVNLGGGYTKNYWNHNYWNRPRILPKLIIGFIETAIGVPLIIPYFNIEWRPALLPNKIG